jgi:hypothetical protein
MDIFSKKHSGRVGTKNELIKKKQGSKNGKSRMNSLDALDMLDGDASISTATTDKSTIRGSLESSQNQGHLLVKFDFDPKISAHLGIEVFPPDFQNFYPDGGTIGGDPYFSQNSLSTFKGDSKTLSSSSLPSFDEKLIRPPSRNRVRHNNKHVQSISSKYNRNRIESILDDFYSDSVEDEFSLEAAVNDSSHGSTTSVALETPTDHNSKSLQTKKAITGDSSNQRRRSIPIILDSIRSEDEDDDNDKVRNSESDQYQQHKDSTDNNPLSQNKKPESPRGVSDFHKMTALHSDKITHHDTTIHPENQTVAENRVIISSNACNPYVFDRCNSADRSQISGCSAYSTPSIMALKNRLRKIEEEFRTSYTHHVCDPCGAAT